MRILINWERVLPILEQVSLIRVYLTIISTTQPDYKWYSNLESRSKIEWRWQMAPSTVKNAIAQLAKKGFIKPISRGVYEIERKYLANAMAQED